MPAGSVSSATLNIIFCTSRPGVMGILVALPKPGSLFIKYSAAVILDCACKTVAEIMQ